MVFNCTSRFDTTDIDDDSMRARIDLLAMVPQDSSQSHCAWFEAPSALTVRIDCSVSMRCAFLAALAS